MRSPKELDRFIRKAGIRSAADQIQADISRVIRDALGPSGSVANRAGAAKQAEPEPMERRRLRAY